MTIDMKYLLFFCLLMTAAFAEPGEELRKGEPVPVFEAADQNGVLHSMENLGGPNGLVLVVFRSADW